MVKLLPRSRLSDAIRLILDRCATASGGGRTAPLPDCKTISILEYLLFQLNFLGDLAQLNPRLTQAEERADGVETSAHTVQAQK